MGRFLHLLQAVPVWIAGVIQAAIGIAVSQLCLWVVGRLADVERQRSNEMIALALSVTAVIDTVPLALIAGEAWGDFGRGPRGRRGGQDHTARGDVVTRSGPGGPRARHSHFSAFALGTGLYAALLLATD